PGGSVLGPVAGEPAVSATGCGEELVEERLRRPHHSLRSPAIAPRPGGQRQPPGPGRLTPVRARGRGPHHDHRAEPPGHSHNPTRPARLLSGAGPASGELQASSRAYWVSAGGRGQRSGPNRSHDEP